MAFALGGMAIHVLGSLSTALLSAAAALAAMAAFTAGPLGISSVLGRRLHRLLDLVVALGLGLSPVLVRGHIDVGGAIMGVAAAVVLLRVSLSTCYAPTDRHVQAEREPLSDPGTPAGVASKEARVPGFPTIRTLGFLTGRARRLGGRQFLERGARGLGTTVGRGRRPPPSSG